MKTKHPIIVMTTALICTVAPLYQELSADSLTLYRYKNEQGVVVMHHSIPARYAQKGYEVINSSGKVLKVIPPAPNEEEIEAASQQRQILSQYEVLKRRFSNTDEIERAKQRKLENIDTNISILKGNINNLEVRINELISRAAKFERTGKKVPSVILKQIDDTKAELKISRDLLNNRKQEYEEVAQKYDQDIKTYLFGENLSNIMPQQNNPN